jgi:predicted DNA-binding transcriptional regulator AlpA
MSERLLSWESVCERLDMGRTSAWALFKRDPRFPRQITPPGSRARFREAELDAYIQLLAAERDERKESA